MEESPGPEGEGVDRFESGWFHHRVALAGCQEPVRIQPVLSGVQIVVPAAQRKERLVRAVFHDVPAFDHQYLVGAPDGGEPVCNHKRRAPLHQEAQSMLNHRLTLRIE
jgi:hypothetical protein